MSIKQFGIRLHEARKMSHLSMDQLTQMMGNKVTKQSISQYERGMISPKESVLLELSRVLDISEGYFLGKGVMISRPCLRTSFGSIVTEAELESLEARLSFWAERYIVKEKKVRCVKPFVNPLSDISISTADEAIAAAVELRRCWNCGDGPIASVLRLMERKGIKILSTRLPHTLLGLSTWADEKHPLIALDFDETRTSVEQIRFTACHELGHLLLSFVPEPEMSIEKLCNKFASFFLFPRSTFIEELGGRQRERLTLEELSDLKSVYGVSVAAQVHEAADIGMISTDHYHWWFENVISKNKPERGWGHYPMSETVGREKRIDSLLESGERSK